MAGHKNDYQELKKFDRSIISDLPLDKMKEYSPHTEDFNL